MYMCVCVCICIYVYTYMYTHMYVCVALIMHPLYSFSNFGLIVQYSLHSLLFISGFLFTSVQQRLFSLLIFSRYSVWF